MKKALKILGISALVAGLIPYKVKKDDETGELQIRALLWGVSRGPKDSEEGDELQVSLGIDLNDEEEDYENYEVPQPNLVWESTPAPEAEEATVEEPVPQPEG